MPTSRRVAGSEPAPIELADAAPAAGALTPVQREIVELCADTVQQLGLARSVGQIYGVIYASPRPLAFADVVAGLGISNGSVSQGLRFLRELGAVRLVDEPEDRRELFVAETELRRLLGGVLEHRFRAPLEVSAARLKMLAARADPADAPHREFLEQRVESLRSWHRTALRLLPLLQTLIGRGKQAEDGA